MEPQLSSTATATASLLLLLQVFPSAWRLGTSLLSTNSILESSLTEGAPVAEGEPEEANGIGDPRKTTETETRTSWETVCTCTVPVCKFPAKFG